MANFIDDPIDELITAAETIADSSTSDRQQQAAVSRAKRLRTRAPELGVGVFDFQVVNEPTYRIYYNLQNNRADGQLDNLLASMLTTPTATDHTLFVRLTDRPFIRLKENKGDTSFQPDGGVAFHTARDAKFSTRSEGETASPLETGDTVILFDDNHLRPVFRAKVVDVLRNETYAAASGTLGLILERYHK